MEKVNLTVLLERNYWLSEWHSDLSHFLPSMAENVPYAFTLVGTGCLLQMHGNRFRISHLREFFVNSWSQLDEKPTSRHSSSVRFGRPYTNQLHSARDNAASGFEDPRPACRCRHNGGAHARSKLERWQGSGLLQSSARIADHAF